MKTNAEKLPSPWVCGHSAGGADGTPLCRDPRLRRRGHQRRKPDRPAVGHVGLRDALDWHLPLPLGRARRGHHRQHPRLGVGHRHPAADRRHRRHVDDLGRGPDDDLLRTANPPPVVLPRGFVRDLRRGVADDRIVVDHHRHHRRGTHGHRPGDGLFGRMGRRSHHLGSLFRRQASRCSPTPRCWPRRRPASRSSPTSATCSTPPFRRCSSPSGSSPSRAWRSTTEFRPMPKCMPRRSPRRFASRRGSSRCRWPRECSSRENSRPS